jgi:hypothetical protein
MIASKSPVILSIAWGRMEVEGLGSDKDFKLHPGGGRRWDWSETGTRHSPGIQLADVEEIVAKGATVIVLSCGMERRLGVDLATLRWLDEHGMEVHVCETSKAVNLYNEIATTRAVGGLFHSTC